MGYEPTGSLVSVRAFRDEEKWSEILVDSVLLTYFR